MTVGTRKALGARIRFLRKAENLSQEKLALMVGVERSYLAKLETGKRNPSIDVIEKIAGGLNVTLSELFRGIDATPPPTPTSQVKAPATGARNRTGARCHLTGT